MSRTLFTSFFTFMSAVSIGWAQADVKATFEAANAAYADGNYDDAIIGYESILEERMHFESEYNLGNAYYKLGNWGPAILHYERVALLSRPTKTSEPIWSWRMPKSRTESSRCLPMESPMSGNALRPWKVSVVGPHHVVRMDIGLSRTGLAALGKGR